MENKLKIFLAALGIGFICLVIWVVRTTPDAPPAIEKVEPPKTMEYEGNTISEEINGVKLWELTADKVTVGIETQVADLTNVVGHFYQSDGRSIELHADIGSYSNIDKNVHLQGNVVVTTSEGAKLTSDKLDWLSTEEVLIATDKVRITRDDVQAIGDRAESRDGFKKFTLKGRVHIIKGVENNR